MCKNLSLGMSLMACIKCIYYCIKPCLLIQVSLFPLTLKIWKQIHHILKRIIPNRSSLRRNPFRFRFLGVNVEIRAIARGSQFRFVGSPDGARVEEVPFDVLEPGMIFDIGNAVGLDAQPFCRILLK